MVAGKILLHIIYIYRYLFLRIHRHSKNGDEKFGPSRGEKIRALCTNTFEDTQCSSLLFLVSRVSTDAPSLFKSPLRHRLVNTFRHSFNAFSCKQHQTQTKELLCCSPSSDRLGTEASSTPREWLARQTSAGRDFWTWQWRMAGGVVVPRIDLYN